LFARLSGVSKKQDGYIQRRDYGCDHLQSGVPPLVSVGQGCVLGYDGSVDYSALRGMLRFVASDNLEITGAVDYTSDQRDAAGTVLVQGTSTVNPNVQPVQGVTSLPASAFVVPRGSYYNYATYYNPKNTFTALTGANAGRTTPTDETRADDGVDFSGWGASGHVDWKLTDELSLVSISAYREYTSSFSNDNDLSPLAASLGYGTLQFHSFSQEVRLNGALLDDNRLEYTVGAFYMDQKSTYATTQDLRYSATGLTALQGDDPRQQGRLSREPAVRLDRSHHDVRANRDGVQGWWRLATAVLGRAGSAIRSGRAAVLRSGRQVGLPRSARAPQRLGVLQRLLGYAADALVLPAIRCRLAVRGGGERRRCGDQRCRARNRDSSARASVDRRFDGRLTWRNSDDTWESSLEVTNLTDQYYFLTRFDQYTLTGVTDGQLRAAAICASASETSVAHPFEWHSLSDGSRYFTTFLTAAQMRASSGMTNASSGSLYGTVVSCAVT
jgi:hypothetical protein